jgi:hypothetical protein
MLIPVYPNRHIVPTEVAQIVGARRNAARERHREQIRAFVLEGDHAPHRARFSTHAALFAMGLALVVREPGSEVRSGIGTPKSLVSKLATRFGREPREVALVAALSRAIGLWDTSAISSSAPPGSLDLYDLAQHLFLAWQRGGAWDEARSEPEVLRLPPDRRDCSASGVVRELVLEALRDLGESRWIPWASLEGYLSADRHMAGTERLLRRWAERVSVPATTPMEVARRIVLESLPTLGILDLGEENDDNGKPAIALRLTTIGRWLVTGETPTFDTTESKFIGTKVLRIGNSTTVGAILNLFGFADVERASDTLDLALAPHSLARAISAGYEAATLRQRIEAVAPLPEELSHTLTQASLVVGRGSFALASGFLWVDDPNIRELLRTSRSTAELFVDPSPPAGLLVAPQVDLDRLVRRCRTVGIEIVLEGQVLRGRSIPNRWR